MEILKKYKIWILRVTSYILVAALASFITLVFFGNHSKLDQLEDIILDKFIGETDQTAMEDAAASAMIASLGDRWSHYIPASAYESYLEGKANTYVGIGISITVREDGTGFDIVRVEPNSTAKEAGILPGDILVEAQGQSLAGMDLNGPGELIKGKAGTTVTVGILRDGEKLTFEVKRQTLSLEVATGKMLDNQVGYVRINNFNDHCADHTIEVVDRLVEQGAQSLVFDVRYNPGGYVTEMVEVLDYLLPEGVLYSSVRYDGWEDVEKSDADCIELPMAVLVNGSSYSAAEFFAAALREYDWAVIAGEPTVGKGYFQNTIELNDGSAVGLSVGQYFTPNGVSLAEEGGITPDVTVEVDEQTAAMIYANLLPPAEDPQLQAAIEAMQ